MTGITSTREGFTCVHCGRTSYNPNDLREEYCGNCHHFCRDVDLAVKLARLSEIYGQGDRS